MTVFRSGCKLAFRYKNRDYWLNVMSCEKKGFEVELTAYSLGLELNNETRGEHKPANAMSIAEYVAYYDPEHALTIGVNEVSDKDESNWNGRAQTRFLHVFFLLRTVLVQNLIFKR